MRSPLDFARDADKAVDDIVAANTDGQPLFYVDDEDHHFVNGVIVHQVYTAMAIMGALGRAGQAELSNMSYLLAAIESRSRGKRLLDEFNEGIENGTLPASDDLF